MGFVSICTAVYDYQPQSDGELDLKEGELLYILEKSSEDDWWKAKKKADDEDEDEPEGLIPNNYVEEAKPISKARALYDYTRQTDEEVSFSEDATLEIYDTEDPDWTLVHVNGEYGFAPANYIEALEATPQSPAAVSLRSPISAVPRVPEPEPEQEPSPPASPVRDSQSAAANLARVLGGRAPPSPIATREVSSPSIPRREPTPEPSDEEPAPALPQRPRSQTIPAAPPADTEPPGVLPSPPYNRVSMRYENDPGPQQSPRGYHLYNVNEMVSAMGRRKKMPITLGLNIAAGTIMLSPEKSRDGPTQEWAADKLQHYSIEGKHVFMELVRPSKSLDLHAGAKDTAQEIVAALGEIAGAHRAEGLKEVITAASGSGQKKGVMLYDFMAQGDDEVTVAEGDEVIVLDDTKSEEWWNVRRVKNGKEGVVPSSYIEVTGTIAVEPPSRTGINAGRSTVEQNRLEEQRMAKEAAKANRAQREAEEAGAREIELPERGSSLGTEERRSSKRDKRSSKNEGKSRSKPDPTKTRTWTDHSGSFKVDAQFIGVADGKIHLHKVNGVKIAVPVAKMSPEDLEYIEKMKRKQEPGRSGASVEPTKPKVPDYDWFEFFLSAGVGPHQCERYSQAMVRDSMDESILPDISMETLRTLGLKEGDAIKVMKHLDQRFGRNRVNGDGQTGGLFSGPGGALKNNRQRPEADRKTSDKVDATAFQQDDGSKVPADATATPLTQAPARDAKDGFEDDAWTVKPSTQPTATSSKQVVATPPPAPRPSENLAALSLLDKPLEPTPAAPPQPVSQPQVSQPAQQPAPTQSPQQPQQTGATPQFFQQVGQQAGSYQLNVPRQRPQAPQQSYTGSALLPPPPRPTSAPQNAQQSQFGPQPLQPQLTGMPTNAHPAPPGQSLDDLTAQRMQQYAQMRPQPTGFPQQSFGMPNGMQPQPTGFQPQQFGQMQQPYLNGNATGSPFGDQMAIPPQQTGFVNFQQRPQGGINSILPPALAPQKTGYQSPPPQMQLNGFNQFQQQPQQQGFQPQPTGFQPQQQMPQPGFQQSFQSQPTGFQQQMQPQPTGFGQPNGFGNIQTPPVPPIPQQSTPAPLVPQRTGPAPNIKFGVPDAKKLQPQPTGRRANLSAATPQNPFGF